MNIVCVGGGPAGLYFSILAKKADPSRRVRVFERNRKGDTFGFGVVFSDKTLAHLGEIDRPSYDRITQGFVHWDDIEVHVKGELIRSTGHGFSGIGRARLLEILEERAIELGVEIHHERELSPDAEELVGADLVLVCDGVQSGFRARHEAHFKPRVDLRKSRFVWLGTTRPFNAFTFYFKEAEAGLFQVHAYQYEPNRSTFIVECSEETFARSGLGGADEETTRRTLEGIFAEELAGHPLLTNRSIWRQFPVIRNDAWSFDRTVILGDAAHTAHFSIGSGTKLAIEDAIALASAIERAPTVVEALRLFDAEHRPKVDSIQRAAQVSLEWFENTERHFKKAPLHFAYSLLTRSLRVTHDNLKVRDPELVLRVEREQEALAEEQTKAALPKRADGREEPRPPMFLPLRLRSLVLENRVGLSPMCMYSATDGTVNDFHLVHLGSRAIGGAGLILTEMTNVSPDGRITPGCAGLWSDEHAQQWRRITDFVHHQSGAKIGLQVGHAGRKGATLPPWKGRDVPLGEGGWGLIAPSAIPWSSGHPIPKAMDDADMERVIGDFVATTHRAEAAGFDLLELHAAHGYLLATFLSPLTNQRTDRFGGSIENRLRFPLQVFRAMRAVWPSDKPMAVRVSACDWEPKSGALGTGFSPEDLVATAKAFRDEGCDLIDVSSAGTIFEQEPAYGRLFQVPFAELVKEAVPGIAVAAVGNIASASDLNTVIAARRADLGLVARAHLFDPYWVRHAAQAQGYNLPWPKPYGLMATYTPRG